MLEHGSLSLHFSLALPLSFHPHPCCVSCLGCTPPPLPLLTLPCLGLSPLCHSREQDEGCLCIRYCYDTAPPSCPLSSRASPWQRDEEGCGISEDRGRMRGEGGGAREREGREKGERSEREGACVCACAEREREWRRRETREVDQRIQPPYATPSLLSSPTDPLSPHPRSPTPSLPSPRPLFALTRGL